MFRVQSLVNLPHYLEASVSSDMNLLQGSYVRSIGVQCLMGEEHLRCRPGTPSFHAFHIIITSLHIKIALVLPLSTPPSVPSLPRFATTSFSLPLNSSPFVTQTHTLPDFISHLCLLLPPSLCLSRKRVVSDDLLTISRAKGVRVRCGSAFEVPLPHGDLGLSYCIAGAV